MLLGTSGTSFLGNVVTGNGINRAGEGIVRTGDGVIRASEKNKTDFY